MRRKNLSVRKPRPSPRALLGPCDYGHEISVIDINTKTCVEDINIMPALGPHRLILYVSAEELEKG